jgi:hypothetical protein
MIGQYLPNKTKMILFIGLKNFAKVMFSYSKNALCKKKISRHIKLTIHGVLNVNEIKN